MKIHIDNFNIEQIANSGQCFRMNQDKSGFWNLKAFGKNLKIFQIDDDNNYEFNCSDLEFKEIWFDYFDLSRDYQKIKNIILDTGDQYLIAASKYGYGIRILQQDAWETTVSFIISQRNSITRIKNIIAKLCENLEDEFPTPHILASYSEKDLQQFGLGYRAKYLKDIAEAVLSGKLDFEKLKSLEYKCAVSYLKNFNGIGDKVADCIALFGLHKVEAFPIDTWIQYIINTHYNGHFNTDQFYGCAGIIQQYMFFYQKHLGKIQSPVFDSFP